MIALRNDFSIASLKVHFQVNHAQLKHTAWIVVTFLNNTYRICEKCKL